MAQVSYGTITVSDLTDITDVFLQYAKAIDSVTITNDYAFSQTGEIGWYTLTLDTSIVADKYYFELINNEYKIVSNPTGNPATHRWYESSVYPTWTSGYQIWIRQVTIKDGIDVPDYGTPYLDTAVSQINNRISVEETAREALASRLKKIWINEVTSGDYVAGTYAASGIENIVFNEISPQTYGFNTLLRHNKLALRYNTIDMTSLTTTALTFYRPAQDSNNNYVQGKKGLELNADSLVFYKPLAYNSSNSEIAAATLSSTGLNIVDGSITLGSTFSVNRNGELTATAGSIGGFIIDATSIHSVGKTLNNNVSGLYMDSQGQFNTGDTTNFIASWYDTNENKWKVRIQSDLITFSNGQSVSGVVTGAVTAANAASEAVEDMQDRMDSGEFKGEKGDTGPQGVSVTNVTSTNNTSDGGTSVVTVTLSDGTTKTFNVKNGNKGSTGDTAEWFYGTDITHTEGTATFTVAGAVVGSMYLNTQTSLVYKCTSIVSGVMSWTYAGDLTTGVIDNIEPIIQEIGENINDVDKTLKGSLSGLADVTVSTTGISESSIEIKESDFANKIGDDGTYTFSYTDGTGWTLNDEVVDISDYGIIIADGVTPTNGDSITITATDVVVGISYITANVQNTAEDTATYAESLKAIVDQHTEEISGLQGTDELYGERIETNEEIIAKTTTDVGALTAATTSLQVELQNELSERAAFVEFGTTDQGQPILILRGGETANLQAALTNSMLEFIDDGTPVAYISGQKLFISTAQITDQLRFGDFAFIPRGNGNLSLKYVGDE